MSSADHFFEHNFYDFLMFLKRMLGFKKSAFSFNLLLSCSVLSLAVVRSHRFPQFNKNFRGKWLSYICLAEFALDRSP